MGFKSEEVYREVLKLMRKEWNHLSGINLVQDVETYKNFQLKCLKKNSQVKKNVEPPHEGSRHPHLFPWEHLSWLMTLCLSLA